VSDLASELNHENKDKEKKKRKAGAKKRPKNQQAAAAAAERAQQQQAEEEAMGDIVNLSVHVLEILRDTRSAVEGWIDNDGIYDGGAMIMKVISGVAISMYVLVQYYY
jgi:hypothetical protein